MAKEAAVEKAKKAAIWRMRLNGQWDSLEVRLQTVVMIKTISTIY